MDAAQLAQALGAHTEHNGVYKAHCPAHDDHTPSLEITDKNGKVVFICRAGCSQDAVLSAMKDRGVPDAKVRQDPAPQIKSKVVARYYYRDQYGKVLYCKERLEPGRSGKKKEFRFRHNDPTTGKDEFGHGKHNPHVFYNLSNVLKSKSVIVVEGEGLVDRLTEWGLAATTLDAGSGSRLTPEQIEQLSGKRIAILRDPDEPGLVYATNTANDLQGKCESLKVILLPGLGPKEDFKEWQYKPGNDKAALLAIIKEAPEWEPAAPQEAENEDPLTAAVSRLAKLSPLEYDRIRKDEAKALGVRPGTLDAAIKGARKEDVNDSPFDEVDPWHEPVNGAVLLSTLTATIRRFIICELHIAQSVALWVAMTWFMDVVQVAPLAVITAPEKRCGKSLLLFLIGRLVSRPLMSSSISPSALFRSIDLWNPTLLIDETDACLKDNEELRGLINCGHTRDSAFTIRCVGDDHTPKPFSVWGAKALSGIGYVADTLVDRSIILELRRKLPDESVDRIRHAEPGLFIELRQKLARFADDNSERVKLARPELPPSLNDRAQDNWEPLLAIAMVAGGDWYNIGTATALKLSGGESLSLSIGTELLVDIQEIFERMKIDRISSVDLIKELCADDEKPWATYNKGFQIKPRQIATRLKGYGVHSKPIRSGCTVSKGYELKQFQEVFSRYLAPPPPVTVTELQTGVQAGLAVTDNELRNFSVTDEKTRKPAPIQGCNSVTDRTPLAVSEVIDLTGIDFEVTA